MDSGDIDPDYEICLYMAFKIYHSRVAKRKASKAVNTGEVQPKVNIDSQTKDGDKIYKATSDEKPKALHQHSTTSEKDEKPKASKEPSNTNDDSDLQGHPSLDTSGTVEIGLLRRPRNKDSSGPSESSFFDPTDSSQYWYPKPNYYNNPLPVDKAAVQEKAEEVDRRKEEDFNAKLTHKDEVDPSVEEDFKAKHTHKDANDCFSTKETDGTPSNKMSLATSSTPDSVSEEYKTVYIRVESDEMKKGGVYTRINGILFKLESVKDSSFSDRKRQGPGDDIINKSRKKLQFSSNEIQVNGVKYTVQPKQEKTTKVGNKKMAKAQYDDDDPSETSN